VSGPSRASEPPVRTTTEARVVDTPAALDALRHRLDWLAGRVPAPRVLRSEAEPEPALVVEAIPGERATSVAHRLDATRAIASFAAALAAVHALDPAECPFEIDVAALVDDIVQRARSGELTVEDPAYAHVAPTRLAGLLADGMDRFAAPSRPVVCNGHPTLGTCVIDGAVAGFERIDGLGVADVCLDLAIAARSVASEFAPSFVGPFFEAYDESGDIGAIDLARLDWFQLLDALR
jgi:aminoglycoside 3'-phosphotransferase-2